MKLNKTDKKMKNYIWNMIAGMLNALQSVIILFVLVRTNGAYWAGIFTIGFSIANLLLNIGHFNVRNYQVTDSTSKFTFADYFSARCITYIIMVISSLGYVLYGMIWQNYSVSKGICIFLICLFKGMDCVEDVFWGDMQKRGHLDVASQYMSIRLSIVTTVLCAGLVLTHNLCISLIISIFVGYLAMFFIVRKCYYMYMIEPIHFRSRYAVNILKECSSLFINAFLAFYVLNAAKYSIDIFCSQEEQAYYGYISLPVLLISLLSNFLYQPVLSDLATFWNQHQLAKFFRTVAKQVFWLIGMAAIIIILGNILGIPILSYMYHFEATAYIREFNILLIASVLYACVGLDLLIITIMRKQQILSVVYILLAGITYFLANRLVIKYGLMGAAIQNLISMVVALAILSILIIFFSIREKK